MAPSVYSEMIQWMGVRLTVPESWQIVRHGLSPRRGRLVMVDRYRQRLQVNWSPCPRPPALNRMIEDYRARQLEAQPQAKLVELGRVPGWRGVRRCFGESGQDLTRAVRHDAQTGRLLEAIIITRPEDPADDRMVEQVLERMRVVEPAERITRWRAFDMDIIAPPGWRLTSTRIKPADAVLSFQQMRPHGKNAPTGGGLTVRRMGMAGSWYHDDDERFLRGSAPKVNFTVDAVVRQGGAATRACGVEAGPRLKRMLGMLRRREDWLWRCEGCNAVYHASLRSPKRRPIEPEAFEVRCGRGCGQAGRGERHAGRLVANESA